jgi:predicted nucleotidyltransferase
VRERWVTERGMTVFSMWDPDDPLRSVDLFVEQPIDFEELWERSVVVDIEGTPVRVASIVDLIRLKRIADRPMDREDIAALEHIQERGRDR